MTYNSRALFSNDRKQLLKYLEQVDSHLKANNAYDTMDILNLSTLLELNRIKKLDKIITQACLLGVEQVKKKLTPWWSVSLHQTQYMQWIINKAIYQKKQNQLQMHNLQSLLDIHSCDITLTDNLATLLQLHKQN